MSNLLGTAAPLLSDISLIIQSTVILVLIGAVYRAKGRLYLQHAYLMLACTALNTLSIAIIMIPVAWALSQGVAFSSFLVLVLIHAITGIIVLAVSYYLMWEWRLNKPGPCFKQKIKMRLLSFAWVAEVIMGIVIYVLLYL